MQNRPDNEWRVEVQFRLEELSRKVKQTEDDNKARDVELDEFKKEVRENYMTDEIAELKFGSFNKFKSWGLIIVGSALVAAFLKLVIK